MSETVQVIAVDKVQSQRIGDPSAPGLRRNVLTEDGKRWQLWGKGIRGKDADEIIEKLYVV